MFPVVLRPRATENSLRSTEKCPAMKPEDAMRTGSHRTRFIIAFTTLILVVGTPARAADGENIDWNKARELVRRESSGEKISPEDRAYLERAKAERARLMKEGQWPPPAMRDNAPAANAAAPVRETT